MAVCRTRSRWESTSSRRSRSARSPPSSWSEPWNGSGNPSAPWSRGRECRGRRKSPPCRLQGEGRHRRESDSGDATHLESPRGNTLAAPFSKWAEEDKNIRPAVWGERLPPLSWHSRHWRKKIKKVLIQIAADSTHLSDVKGHWFALKVSLRACDSKVGGAVCDPRRALEEASGQQILPDRQCCTPQQKPSHTHAHTASL